MARGAVADAEYVHQLEDAARALAEMWNDPVKVARHLVELLEESKPRPAE